MNARLLLVLLGFVVTASSLHAQQVYKYTGPDGKVTFSDKPPANPATEYSVVRGAKTSPTAATPVIEPTPSSPTSHSSSGGTKRATRVTAPDAHKAADKPLDPALERAVLGVLSMEDLVRQMIELCVHTLPTSFRKYDAAAAGWRQRNQSILQVQQQAFSELFSASERSLLQIGAQKKNRENLNVVINASAAARISWCDKSAAEINGGELDLATKPNLSTPLLNYRSAP